MRRSLVAITVAIALLTGACSGGPATSSPGTSQPAQSASATSSTAPAAPTKLTFWTLQQSDVDINAAQKKAVAEFEATNNATVEVTTYPYGELQDKLLLAAQSHSGPDILLLDQIWVAQYAAAGYVAPIDDLVASLNVKKEAYFPGAWNSGLYNGKQYTMPFDVGDWGFVYYNKDKFKGAGLDPENPPKTWDEFNTAAKALTKAPDKWAIAISGDQGDAPQCQVDGLTYSGGGQILDPTTGKAVWSQGSGPAAVDFYSGLQKYGPPGAVSRGDEDAFTLFSSGQTAMVIYGEWGQDTLKARNVTFDWSRMLLPYPTGGKSVGCFGGFNLAISVDSKNKELAGKFIQYAISPEKQLDITLLTPANREAAKTYLQARRTQPDLILQALDQGGFRPLVPDYPALGQIQRKAIQSVMLGQASSADALAQADVEINKLLGK